MTGDCRDACGARSRRLCAPAVRRMALAVARRDQPVDICGRRRRVGPAGA
jgi:hypothetical protein